MREIQAPNPIPEDVGPKIFLAGSIEMGSASPWQESVVRMFENNDVLILNPRRVDWDNSIEKNKNNPNFRKQVEWELDALAMSDYIILHFEDKTKSPISLLELGLHASGGHLFVVCDGNFWRRGNVDIVCERYNIPQFSSLRECVVHIQERINGL